MTLDQDDQALHGRRPDPDPTELTDKAIAKAVVLLTQYVDGKIEKLEQRLQGIDTATDLRLRTIDHMPDRIDEKVSNLRELHEEKLRTVATQFAERDTRGEREARDNTKAVDAAFAAQKEAAAKQDEGNQKAIDKSEKATAEKIDKLEQLFATTTDALRDKIEDVKRSLTDVATTANGTVQQRVGAKEDRTTLYAGFAIIATILGAAIGVVGFIAGKG